LEAEGSRRAEQDKGRRRRAEGAGPAAQKPENRFIRLKINGQWLQPSVFRNKFCAAGSGIFIPPPAP